MLFVIYCWEALPWIVQTQLSDNKFALEIRIPRVYSPLRTKFKIVLYYTLLFVVIVRIARK